MTDLKDKSDALNTKIQDLKLQFQKVMQSCQAREWADSVSTLKSMLPALRQTASGIGESFEDAFWATHLPAIDKNIEKISRLKAEKDGEEIMNAFIPILGQVKKSIDALADDYHRLFPPKYSWPVLSKIQKKWLLIGTVVGVCVLIIGGLWNRSSDAQKGLTADYYSDQDFGQLYRKLKTSDINFNWGRRSPLPKWKKDHFSIRYSGYLLVPEKGTVSFATFSDDGVRLWVGKNLLIDDWASHPIKRNQAKIKLQKGYYPIRLDYYDDLSKAAISLYWKRKNKKWEIIDASYFVPSSEYLKKKISLHEGSN